MIGIIQNYKLIGYALAAIAIALLVGRINAWRAGYEREKATAKSLVTVTRQLDAELNCTQGSRCAKQLLQQAKDAQQAVAEAQQKAKADYDKERADQQKRQDADKQKIQQNLAAATSKLNELNDRINQNRSKLACEETFTTHDPCL